MRRKPPSASMLCLVLAALTSFSCQVTSQLFSTATPTHTATPTPTSTPTRTPTRTPTLTPTPQPDLSSVVLTLGDLPQDFEELTMEELERFGVKPIDEEVQPKQIFIFVNPRQFQTIVGYNFLLTDRVERIAFDAMVSEPDLFLPAVIHGTASENISDERVLVGLDDIGESRIGISMVAKEEGIALQMDALMFRRGVIGAFIMSSRLPGRKPTITIQELGRILDERMLVHPAVAP